MDITPPWNLLLNFERLYLLVAVAQDLHIDGPRTGRLRGDGALLYGPFTRGLRNPRTWPRRPRRRRSYAPADGGASRGKNVLIAVLPQKELEPSLHARQREPLGLIGCDVEGNGGDYYGFAFRFLLYYLARGQDGDVLEYYLAHRALPAFGLLVRQDHVHHVARGNEPGYTRDLVNAHGHGPVPLGDLVGEDPRGASLRNEFRLGDRVSGLYALERDPAHGARLGQNRPLGDVGLGPGYDLDLGPLYGGPYGYVLGGHDDLFGGHRLLYYLLLFPQIIVQEPTRDRRNRNGDHPNNNNRPRFSCHDYLPLSSLAKKPTSGPQTSSLISHTSWRLSRSRTSPLSRTQARGRPK